MSDDRLFYASAANTIAFDVTDTTDRVALSYGGPTIRIFNAGDGIVFIEKGGSSVTATIPTDGGSAGSMPIAPGRETGITITPIEGVTHIAAICPSGETATLYITPGNGI